jgi:hypothetical protein
MGQMVTLFYTILYYSPIVLQVSVLDPFTLCPPSAEGGKKEQLLQIICLVLAVVNMFVFSKLLYDYHKYKNTGKLPRIISWIPFL